MTTSPKRPTLPQQALRLLAIAGLVLIVGSWMRSYSESLRAASDPVWAADLQAAQERAQPLLDALEKYHADNGLYPATLGKLSPAYLVSAQDFSRFRYSARHSDWVRESDDCIEDSSSQAVKVKHNCVTGYREFQLQSPGFRVDARSRDLARWAYYDSQPRYWAVGWCEEVRGSKENTRVLATNGVCR